MNSTINNHITINDIPTNWDELIALYPLRPIHDGIDQENITEIIDAMAGHDLTNDQEDYLDSISTFLSAYEAQHHPVAIKKLSGLEILHSFLEDRNMSAADLGRLLNVHRSHGAKILRGKRALTIEHIKILAKYFCVQPSLFID